MSILVSRANEVFWEMAKCGNLNNKLYKNSLECLNLKGAKVNHSFTQTKFPYALLTKFSFC